MLKTIVGLELMAMLENVPADSPEAEEFMSTVRVLIHQAVDRGEIPVSEWRLLIESSVVMQSEFKWRSS